MDKIKNNQNKKMEPESSVDKYRRDLPDVIIRARNSYRKQRRFMIGSGLIGLFLIIVGSISFGTGIGIYLLIIALPMLAFAVVMAIAAKSNSILLKEFEKTEYPKF